MNVVHRNCALCEAGCGLRYEVEGHNIRSVRPDPEDVYSAGYVCPKGIANAELHADPDRLRTPMRRTVSGDFEAIGWEEAFDLAAGGLARVRERAGADAVAVYFGNPIIHDAGALFAKSGITRAIGTKNSYSAGSQDTSPRFATSHLLYGSSFAIPIPDLARTDYLLCLGANPLVSNGSFLTAPDMRGRLRALRDRGGRLVVVDPRRSETARVADEHIAVLPGGDAALLLGMLRVLIAEERIDRQAVAALSRGFDAVEGAVLRLDPKALALQSGVGEAEIERLARDFAQADHAVVYMRIGTSNSRHGTLATYAGDLLNLVVGGLGALGGAVFARPAIDINRLMALPDMDGYARFHSRVRGLPETLGDLPAACMAEEMETAGPGQIRALLTYAGNPALSVPNGRRLSRALAELDFMVSLDLYINETTRHADLILPPAGPHAEEHCDLLLSNFLLRNVVKLSAPVVPKAEGEWHDWEILRELAVRLGGGLLGVPPVDLLLNGARRLGLDITPHHLLEGMLRTGNSGDRFWPFGSGLNFKKLRAHPHGVDLGDVQPGVADRISHRDGKMHLDADPLLGAITAFEGQLGTRPEPGELLLVGRREVRTGNSWLHNLPSLVSGKERCVLFVHPDDAKAAGLRDGDEAWMTSEVHSGPIPIQLHDDIRPGVVCLPHGWGHAEVLPWQGTAGSHAGTSMNDWTNDAEVEAVVGQSILTGIPVRLSPDERGARVRADRSGGRMRPPVGEPST